jgi:hypothetical protein
MTRFNDINKKSNNKLEVPDQQLPNLQIAVNSNS